MGVREWLLEDDAQVALTKLSSSVEGLGSQMKDLADRMELLEVIMAPKKEDRMFRKPYQIATVNPSAEGEVYRQEIPEGFMGVITRMGNNWFGNTFLTRIIDNQVAEHRIERSIAPVTDPISVKVFVRKLVVWRAQNNDGMPHVFQVLTDGFFIPAKIAEQILELESV